MPEQIGVEQLKKIVGVCAEVINVGYKIAHGAGIFSAFGLISELGVLAGVTAEQLKKEILDRSPEEQAELRDLFNSKLDLADDVLEAKIEDAYKLTGDGVDLAFEAYGLYLKVVAFGEKAKALFASESK